MSAGIEGETPLARQVCSKLTDGSGRHPEIQYKVYKLMLGGRRLTKYACSFLNNGEWDRYIGGHIVDMVEPPLNFHTLMIRLVT